MHEAGGGAPVGGISGGHPRHHAVAGCVAGGGSPNLLGQHPRRPAPLLPKPQFRRLWCASFGAVEKKTHLTMLLSRTQLPFGLASAGNLTVIHLSRCLFIYLTVHQQCLSRLLWLLLCTSLHLTLSHTRPGCAGRAADRTRAPQHTRPSSPDQNLMSKSLLCLVIQTTLFS